MHSHLLIVRVRPCFLTRLLATRKGLRTHPMYVDDGVLSVAAFHNVNCEHGFLYFNMKARCFRAVPLLSLGLVSWRHTREQSGFRLN